MNRFLGTSLAKKVVMAVAGLFLISFLIVHLAINFLLLSDDPTRFTKAASFMATNPVIKIFEVILIGGLLIHIIWGVVVQIQNWIARPVSYKVSANTQTSFFSRYMIYTGIIVLIFLFIHFLNFWFIKLGFVEGDQENFYGIAHELFKIPLYIIIYLISFLILAFHLNHAFQSAFQTLGLNHPSYTPIIKTLGLIYSILVPLGFAIIPIIIYFFK